MSETENEPTSTTRYVMRGRFRAPSNQRGLYVSDVVPHDQPNPDMEFNDEPTAE